MIAATTASDLPSARSAPAAPEEPPDAAAQPSYTERLLKAKKKVWQDRDEEKKQP